MDDTSYTSDTSDCESTYKEVVKKSKLAEKATHSRTQKYRNLWESSYKWLKPMPGNAEKCKCTLCGIDMKAQLSVIKMHEKGTKHQQKIKEAPSTSKIDTFLKNPIGESVKKFEIWISAYLAEHNIAFNAVDHLINGLKFHLKDPIVQNCKLSRTKATAIVKNVIGKCHQTDILNYLKKVQFSLLIDESTDCSAIKSICICVRYFNGTTVTNLLALVDLFDKHNMDQASQGATAEHLYKTVIDVLDNANIPHSNLIGFASDGCNTMMGANNSVVSSIGF